MAEGVEPERLRVGLDAALARWAPEVTYALRTLLETAGFAWEWNWVAPDARSAGAWDLFYGRGAAEVRAAVRIEWNGRAFDDAPQLEPQAVCERDGLVHLAFGDEGAEAPEEREGALIDPNDAVFAAFWWLTGAREPHYRRDARDNLYLDGALVRRADLVSRPSVSLYAAFLRERFEAGGKRAQRPAWAPARGRSAFVLTHDVDYPVAIRAIEALRALAPGGAGRAALRALRNPDAFWRFHDWVEFARELGAHPTFFFMARTGSLLRFAAGDPDAFYDATVPRFRALMRELRDRGCEIGLHASYRAHREPQRFAREKERLEEASGGEVYGNRHHYWHLDPDAPHDTLREHERAGFAYDSSLAFELHPGFRRGMCHPFRPFHAGERRELDLVELPPTWMDDHYDGRLAHNGIEDPEAHARGLLDQVARCGGISVVDYHVRGMNEVFFPRWGAWLRTLLGGALPSGATGVLPRDLASQHRSHGERLRAHSIESKP